MSSLSATSQEATRADLVEACAAKRLIPFIGAGFSCNISAKAAFGCFFQDRIRHRIPNIMNLLVLFGGDTARALDFAVWTLSKEDEDTEGSTLNTQYRYGKGKLQEYITSQIGAASLDSVTEDRWKQHLLLVQRFPEIITTNWDDTIEKSCYELGLAYEYHFSINGELHSVRRGNGDSPRRIIKYHGDARHADSLVATETDYYRRIRRSDPLDDELIYHYSKSRFLFAGYSLTDINVRYTLNQVNHLNRYFGRKERPSFMVSVDPLPQDAIEQAAYEQMRRFLYKCGGTEIYHLVDWSTENRKELAFGDTDRELEKKAFPTDPNKWESDEAEYARNKLDNRSEERRKIIQAAWIDLLEAIPAVSTEPTGN